MKKVFIQGSYDLFHFGHLVALEKAKKIANKINGELIVGVNTDKLYRRYKTKEPVIPYKYRKKIIEALKCVDKVISVPDFSPLRILKDYDIDVYVICEEWKDTKEEEIKYMKSQGKKIVILPYFSAISTTEIKDKLVKNYLEHKRYHKKL